MSVVYGVPYHDMECGREGGGYYEVRCRKCWSPWVLRTVRVGKAVDFECDPYCNRGEWWRGSK